MGTTRNNDGKVHIDFKIIFGCYGDTILCFRLNNTCSGMGCILSLCAALLYFAYVFKRKWVKTFWKSIFILTLLYFQLKKGLIFYLQ